MAKEGAPTETIALEESGEEVPQEDTSLSDLVLETMRRREAASSSAFEAFDQEIGEEMDAIKERAASKRVTKKQLMEDFEVLYLKMRAALHDEHRGKERAVEAGDLDELTKVYNRRGFEKAVLGDDEYEGTLEKYRKAKREALESGEDWNEEFVVFMLDIDYFKQFNDTFGHLNGDVALKTFAAKLDHVLRDKVLGRWGGEEFIIQMVTKNHGDRVKVATRLLEEIRKIRINVDGRQIPITASIGMAKLKDGEEFDSLVRRADEALYRAKGKDEEGQEAAPGEPRKAPKGRDRFMIPLDEE